MCNPSVWNTPVGTFSDSQSAICVVFGVCKYVIAHTFLYFLVSEVTKIEQRHAPN